MRKQILKIEFSEKKGTFKLTQNEAAIITIEGKNEAKTVDLNDAIEGGIDESACYGIEIEGGIKSFDTSECHIPVSEIAIKKEWLKPFEDLTFCDVSGIDVSRANSLSALFDECRSLEKIVGLDSWDVSNVKNMYHMFQHCENLRELPIGNWDVSKVYDMDCMFRDCTALRHLPIDNWDVSKVEQMEGIFYGCDSLQELPIANWGVDNVELLLDPYYSDHEEEEEDYEDDEDEYWDDDE